MKIKIFIKILFGFVILTIGITITTLFLNLYQSFSLTFFSSFNGLIETSLKNIKLHWIIFMIASLFFLLIAIYIPNHKIINNFVNRKNKEFNNEKWFWNQEKRDGSYFKYKKRFFVKKNKKDNPNWVINFKGRRKKIKWFVNEKKSDINALIIGGTGSGKTQRVLLPNLIYNMELEDDSKPNFIISDPKKEIIQFVGKRLENNNYKIYAIDFLDYKNSLKWNPLSDILEDIVNAKNENAEEFISIYEKGLQDINNIVESLQWDTKDKGSIWTQQGKGVSLLIIKFLLLLHLDFPKALSKEYFNLSTVSIFFSPGLWDIKAKWLMFIENVVKENKSPLIENWKDILQNINQFVNTAQVTFAGILQNASAAFKVFTSDPTIKRLTSTTISFNLNQISKSKDPYAIFINYPEHRPENHFLVSLLIEQIYRNLIDTLIAKNQQKLDRKVLFMLDEFGNLPNIPNFVNKISICRSKNVFFNIVLQNYQQLRKYDSNGDQAHQVIKDNAQFEYFINSTNISTLKEISESLGKKEVEVTSLSKSSKNTTTNESKKEKSVMSVDQIKNKKEDYMIISKPGLLPIYIKSSMAYKYFKNDNYVFKSDEVNSNEAIFSWNPEEIITYSTEGINHGIQEVVDVLIELTKESLQDKKDIEDFTARLKEHKFMSESVREEVIAINKSIEETLVEQQNNLEPLNKKVINELMSKESKKLPNTNEKYFSRTNLYKQVNDLWSEIVEKRNYIKSYEEWKKAKETLKDNQTPTTINTEKELKIKCLKEYWKLGKNPKIIKE